MIPGVSRSAAALPADEHNVPLRRRLQRQSLLFALLFCVMLFSLTLVLISWRVDQMLTELSQERSDRMVRQLVEEAENGMRLGLAASDLEVLNQRLQTMRSQEPAIRAAFVTAADGSVIAQAGDAGLRRLIDPRWNAQLLAGRLAAKAQRRANDVRNLPGYVLTGSMLADPSGAPVASAWLVSDPSAIRVHVHDAAIAIVLKALPLFLLTLGVVYTTLFGWGRLTIEQLQAARPGSGLPISSVRHRPPSRTLLLVLLAGLAVAPLGMIWVARDAARPFVTTEIEQNASAVSATAAGQIAKAVALGIPLPALVGTDALLKERLAAAPELTWLVLRDPHGAVMARAEKSGGSGGSGASAAAPPAQADLEQSTAVGVAGARVAAGYPADYADRALGAMLLDLVLALVIAVVLMRELTRGLWRRSLLFPLLEYRMALTWQHIGELRARRKGASEGTQAAESASVQDATERCHIALRGAEAQAAHSLGFGRSMTQLRFAVFLIALSDELLRPVFSVFASEMQTPAGLLSPAMLAALPVAAFMVTLAIAQPAGPALARKYDLRRALMAATLVGAVALGLTAFARYTWELVVLRAASGAAFGLGLILVQTAIVRYGPARRRAQNLAEVAAAIVAAGIVGPPFGGMIAGRLGDAAAILGCAIAMAGALFAVFRLKLADSTGEQAPTGVRASAPGWRGYLEVLRNPGALAVILGSAVPARLAAVTVLIVVVPLYMRELDQPPAVAGRVLVLYFLCFSLTAAVTSHWADVMSRRRSFIVAGCLLAAASCLVLPALGGIAGMAACCALLGIGQATQSSPQVALVTGIFDHIPVGLRRGTPEQALVAYRLIERFGSIAAPFAVALIVGLLGLSGAVAVIGLLVALSGAAVWITLRHGAPAEPPGIAA